MFIKTTTKNLKVKPGEKKPAKPTGFKKNCVFCKKDLDIDYKNLELLSRYVSGKGRYISRRISGNCAKHQRRLTQEIGKTRFLSLLPNLAR